MNISNKEVVFIKWGDFYECMTYRGVSYYIQNIDGDFICLDDYISQAIPHLIKTNQGMFRVIASRLDASYKIFTSFLVEMGYSRMEALNTRFQWFDNIK